MRYVVFVALGCVLIALESAAAQELVPPPQPSAGSPPSAQLPAPSLLPDLAAPAAPPATPFGSGFAPPPAPPFGSGYAPPPPASPALLFKDPAGNPTFWIGFEGLVWWTRSQPLNVPLITTGPASQGDNAGNLGAPGTRSLNGPLQYGATGGFRMFSGGWFDAEHTIGIDGSFFILGQQSAGFSAGDRTGMGNVVINEPLAGSPPFSTQVSAPGVETGSVVVNNTSRFGGGDIDLLWNVYRGERWTVNLLGGYRYLELDESLSIDANSNLFTTATYTDNMGNVLATAPPGSSVLVLDRFNTRNQFNGGQLGATFQYLRNRVSLAASTKLAIGATHEIVTIDGNTTVYAVNGPAVPLGGGNFATLQNGRYVTNHFALAPELQLSLGFQFTPWLRGQIGYSFLYLTSVARPGNQIDNVYDGVVHPTAPLTSSGWWTQGLNIGLQYRF